MFAGELGPSCNVGVECEISCVVTVDSVDRFNPTDCDICLNGSDAQAGVVNVRFHARASLMEKGAVSTVTNW